MSHLLCIGFVALLLIATIFVITQNTQNSEKFAHEPRVTLQYKQPPFLNESSQLFLNYDQPRVPTDWPPYLVHPTSAPTPTAYFVV
jgi:hypothetical protein